MIALKISPGELEEQKEWESGNVPVNMGDEEFDSYRALQSHLDQFSVSFSIAESGVEIRILRQLNCA